MPTKAELEAEVADLGRQLENAERREANAKATVEGLKEAAAAEPEVPEVAPLPPPSPVDRRQMYVESHPILGITKQANIVKDSVGDGRVGDGAEIVR